MASSFGEGREEVGKGKEGFPASPSHLFSALIALEIPVQVFPLDDPDDHSNLPGQFCKNLFLKDRKGQFYLVIVPEDRKVDLKFLKYQLGAYRNFSFGLKDDLYRILGVRPGGVSPFGLMNDQLNEIRVVIDEELANTEQPLNFHPLDPDKTCLIAYEDLKKFITNRCNHMIEVVNMKS